ncbi:hypothetical protein [Deinococcus psychrotolerans]|uniref:hypothetical protein n=1 Tax=Deinococcus psychrotolerans TaxID=2489213 RepID=UPI001F14EC0E|nr:hypothetical protein [Deinococcus psychrotolerans]
MQGHGRILLVDDNPNDLELALVAFEKSGRAPEVTVARSGQEAMRAADAGGQAGCPR